MEPSDDFDDLLQAGMTVLSEPFPRRSRWARLRAFFGDAFHSGPEPLDAAFFRRLGYRARIAALRAFRQDSLRRMAWYRRRLGLWLVWLSLRAFLARNAGFFYLLLFLFVAGALLLAAWVWQDSILAFVSDLLTPANPPQTPPLPGQTGGTP